MKQEGCLVFDFLKKKKVAEYNFLFYYNNRNQNVVSVVRERESEGGKGTWKSSCRIVQFANFSQMW